MSLTQELNLFERLNPLQRSLISALAALLFYGAWGFAVNFAHGLGAAVKAGCVQGSYSFLLTLCMTMLLEGIFRFNARMFNHKHLINWSTIVICCAVVFSGSWLVNVLSGTPEIFRTVILGYIFGGIYSATYVFSLSRVRFSP